MTGNPQTQVLPINYPVELVSCSFTKHSLESIDKGWLVSGEERFMMPFKSDKTLCMQIIGYLEQGKSQRVRVIHLYGHRVVVSTELIFD